MEEEFNKDDYSKNELKVAQMMVELEKSLIKFYTESSMYDYEKAYGILLYHLAIQQCFILDEGYLPDFLEYSTKMIIEERIDQEKKKDK